MNITNNMISYNRFEVQWPESIASFAKEGMKNFPDRHMTIELPGKVIYCSVAQ